MGEDQEKILKAFTEKSWLDIKASSSWQVFKIISEFVEGFEKLAKIGPCVSIFGSARTKPLDTYYEMAEDVAKRLTQYGYGVITGGGPGIMEAANRGAKLAGGKSVGLAISLPFEESYNAFIDSDKLLQFDYFFVRKVMFTKYAQGFVVLPGGFGTMDELFEALTLIQTKKVGRFPIVLVGEKYWSGLLKWLRETMDNGYHNINPKDLDLMQITDSAEDAVELINNFYKKYNLQPNF